MSDINNLDYDGFVKFVARAYLPEVSGIYYVTLNGKVIYIGQTVNFRQRWREHHKNKELESLNVDVIKIYWKRLPLDKLKEIEGQQIANLMPELNKRQYTGDNGKSVVLQPIHLGTGEQGIMRRIALESLAAQAGYQWNERPSVGRWLVALADGELAKLAA